MKQKIVFVAFLFCSHQFLLSMEPGRIEHSEQVTEPSAENAGMLLEQLKTLDEPELNMSCFCWPLSRNEPVHAVAKQLEQAVKHCPLDYFQHQQLDSFIQEHQGCSGQCCGCNKKELRESALACGIVLTMVCGAMSGMSLLSPNNNCDKYGDSEQEKLCKKDNAEQHFFQNLSFAGAATGLCMTCAGVCARRECNPTLKKVLAMSEAPAPAPLRLVYSVTYNTDAMYTLKSVEISPSTIPARDGQQAAPSSALAENNG